MKYILCIALVACGGSSKSPGDGGISLEAGPQPDAARTYGPTFRFAVVGDTRPPMQDDVAAYPTDIITKIWADVQAQSPRPDFAISTGDYMFATTNHQPLTIDPQLNLYLGARAQYANAVFAALGNHECTGATDSNCGPGSRDGVTPNYTAFMTRLLGPYGITLPYYAFEFAATDASWTAKLVVIAANAWSPTQQAWLDGELARPTTYTFVVRHESATANTAPGVTPSETSISAHPVTLRIVGHTHKYDHLSTSGEVIVGNGGAPIVTAGYYGYVIVERLPTGTIQVTSYDYQSNAIRDQWRINADGSPAP